MRVTGTGHAGMFIETGAGSILCDPWVNPAYFASWFPFPDNSGLDWERLGKCDYLYISHLHRDHFDADHLRTWVSKKATVLLPAYPTSELEDELRELGFTSFIRTVSNEVVELDGGLRIMIQALISPTDGPIGDSSLWVEYDGVRLLNQNDARPAELSEFARLGHVHAHMLQFSGAIWYPMVYELPVAAKTAFGKQKRERQFDRALRYIDDLKASWIFPIAGPPCFLDDELFQFNDIFGDEGNIFPDQQVFLDFLAEQGYTNGVVFLPGTEVEITPDSCNVLKQPVEDPRAFFSTEAKTEYLREYARRQRPVIEAAKRSWSHPEIDVFAELKARLEPLLAESEHIAKGIGGPVRFDLVLDAPNGSGVNGSKVAESNGSTASEANAEASEVAGEEPQEQVESIVIDFVNREVRPYAGEKVRYRFRTRKTLVEHLLATGEVDWVNSLFLSCRFSAARIGQYNEYVYTFFKCLSQERLNYAEGWYAEQKPDAEDIKLGDWIVQRRCPHLKADLARFGKIEDGVLTCQMHGWKFDLATGRCLTSVGHSLRARPAGAPVAEGAGSSAGSSN